MGWQAIRRSWLPVSVILSAMLVGSAPAAPAPIVRTSEDDKLFSAPGARAVAAWEAAGAEFGWSRPSSHSIRPLARREKGRAGVAPTFRFRKYQPGTIGRLPAPSVPFVLHIASPRMTDAGLTELTRFE
jgi:hypothetical protein